MVKKNKECWYDPDKNANISAGGLLIYNDEGVWLIKEMKKNKINYTDPGGRYRFEDCHIHNCIIREFNEETYFSFNLSLDVKSIFDDCVYVYSYGKPVYMCYMIRSEDISSFLQIELDTSIVLERREEILENNKDLPENFYTSLNYDFVTYEFIRSNFDKMSYRLKRILKSFDTINRKIFG